MGSIPTSSAPPRPWWRPAWYELLPEVALSAGLLAFLVDEPDAATSAFASSRAWALMVGVGVAWVAARILMFRFVPSRVARGATFALAAAGVLAVVVLPAYDDDTVVETFPGTRDDTPVAEPAPGTTDGSVAPTSTSAAPPEPLRTGALRGIDHRAEGTVAVYRASAGQLVVGFEDFDIQPGPNYDVYLVPGRDRESLDDAIRLDDLRGNRGTQYYDVPGDTDVTMGDWTVLVWCQTFAVPVAHATPA